MNERKAVKAGAASSERRHYRSPERKRRAQETRARIVAAAESLFVTDGYAATTIRAVAQKAEVADQTVYLVFKNKSALLDAVIDAAIGGPTGTTWRTQLEAALTRPPEELLREFAAATAGVMARTARILAVAEAAAITEPELAESRKQGHAAMRTQFERIAQALHKQRALAAQIRPRDAAAAIYALSNETTFLRLTDGCGWSKGRYGTWLADTLIATLLQPRT